MIKVYYHPKNNKIALGIFYPWSGNKYYLLTKEPIPNEFGIIDITNSWLKDWEYIGEYGDSL